MDDWGSMNKWSSMNNWCSMDNRGSMDSMNHWSMDSMSGMHHRSMDCMSQRSMSNNRCVYCMMSDWNNSCVSNSNRLVSTKSWLNFSKTLGVIYL